MWDYYFDRVTEYGTVSYRATPQSLYLYVFISGLIQILGINIYDRNILVDGLTQTQIFLKGYVARETKMKRDESQSTVLRANAYLNMIGL